MTLDQGLGVQVFVGQGVGAPPGGVSIESEAVEGFFPATEDDVTAIISAKRNSSMPAPSVQRLSPTSCKSRS